jgi:hypothetical protein
MPGDDTIIDTDTDQDGEELRRGGGSLIPPDPLPADDPEPDQRLVDLKKGKARAEIGKAIEPIHEAIYAKDPKYEAARAALESAYAAAAAGGDPGGPLWARYVKADRGFVDVLKYLRIDPRGPEKSLLRAWIEANLTLPGAPVRAILAQRAQIGARLDDRGGPRELALLHAKDKTARREADWKSWSDPVKNIEATLKSYEDRIGILKDLINDAETAPKAIFEFLFEVAPLHLGLRRDTVDQQNTPGLSLIEDALADFDDVADWFKSNKDREGGGLYLVAPSGLGAKRQAVLDSWDAAIDKEAKAKADYDLRPDAAADLTKAYAPLKQAQWVGVAKPHVTPPRG